MKNASILILSLLIASPCDAQLKNLGKKLKQKAQQVLEPDSEILEQGEELARERMADKQGEFDTTSFNYAIAFLDKAESFENQQQGEKLVRTAGFLIEKEGTDTDEARDLYEQGRALYTVRSYSLAEKYLAASILAYAVLDKTEDPVFLKAVGLLGLLFNNMGRYDLADTANAFALEGWKRTLGEGSKGYAAEFNNRAVIAFNKGDYNAAERLSKEALYLTERAEGSGSVPLAISNNNIGILYQHLGRGGEALSHINTCLEIADGELREKSGTYIQLMTNKALVLQENGSLDEAEATYLKAVDLQTSRLKLNRKSDPDYAHLLNNLASLYLVKGQTEKVEPLLKESLGIYFEKFGERHPATAAAKADLGNFLRSDGRLDEARTLLENAYSQRQIILGEAHPSTVQSLEDLAIVQWLSGGIPEASSNYDKVMEYSMAFVNEFFPPMSEVEKTKYWETLKNRFYRFYNFAIQHYSSQDALLEQMINFRLATKGLLLNTTTKIKNTILASGDEEMIELYNQWQDQKRTLAIYYSFSKEEMTAQNINLDSLERAANESERQLSANSVAFAEGMVPKSTNYEAIASQLASNEAIVEMVHLPIFERSFTGSYQYVALVLTKEEPPAVVVLENGDELDGRYYKYYKNAIKNKFDDEYSYAKYWSPLEVKLAGRTKIYFSPDGVYNQVNMHTLRDAKGTYLIQGKDFRTIGNPRDLLAKAASSEGSNDAFLLGFPTYGSSKIPQLPGTQKELAAVKSSLVAGKYKVTDVLGQEANEETLKGIESPTVLHIATHGFFMKDVTSTSNVFGVQVDYAKNNPLLRSGLMLAGASPVEQSTSFSEEEDGTLTAFEATNLQLDDTDLVVLSACETGQGDISSGEGVYGLQRAFEVAGADKLIMSLWKVDDAATQQLMSSFYQKWILSREEVAVAFRTAQLELMETYPEPYYWGAFLVVGN